MAAQEERHVSVMQAQAKQAQSQPCAPRQTPKEIERLSIELDGVFARMRRGSVSMEKEEQQRQGDVYREIKAGAVFRAERGPKRSELAVGCMWIRQRHRVCAMWHAAPPLAAWRGCSTIWPCNVDWSKRSRWWCWMTVPPGCGNLAAEHFPGAVQIVDLYHAKEHVWDVAHAVFGRGTAAGKAWATHACSLLEQGQSETLVSAIEALPSIPPEPGQARTIPEQAVDYFTTNAARMRYPDFRAQGMHLGSGEASAACKTIVSTRAKRSGMRLPS